MVLIKPTYLLEEMYFHTNFSFCRNIQRWGYETMGEQKKNRIIDSNPVWVGRDLKEHLGQPPAMGRFTFHCTRLVSALLAAVGSNWI